MKVQSAFLADVFLVLAVLVLLQMLREGDGSGRVVTLLVVQAVRFETERTLQLVRSIMRLVKMVDAIAMH